MHWYARKCVGQNSLNLFIPEPPSPLIHTELYTTRTQLSDDWWNGIPSPEQTEQVTQTVSPAQQSLPTQSKGNNSQFSSLYFL